jgi:hypothetical protein
LKPAAFISGATALRAEFYGIALNDNKRRVFEESMTPELLGAASVSEAISVGFDSLFGSAWRDGYNRPSDR